MAQKSNRKAKKSSTKQSGDVGRRETMAIGLAALAAMVGPAAAQNEMGGLGGGRTGSPRGTGGVSGFRRALEKADADPTFAAHLKSLAIQARGGSKTATDQLMSAFALSPTQIKQMNAGTNTKPWAFLTSVPCIITLGAATLYFSCAPRDWNICSVAE